jgi:hypothetical protein
MQGSTTEEADVGHVIEVAPIDGGWRVDCAIADQPLLFLSGRRAEEKARDLAGRLAFHGLDSRVLVRDRRGDLIGSIDYYAPN